MYANYAHVVFIKIYQTGMEATSSELRVTGRKVNRMICWRGYCSMIKKQKGCTLGRIEKTRWEIW